MLAKVKGKVGNLRNKIEKKILDIQESQMNELKKEVEDSLIEDMRETLRYATPRSERNKRGELGFGGATATVKSEVLRKPDRIILRIRGVVIDKTTGKPHEIWHLVEGGGQKKAEVQRRVNIRKRRRTEIDELTAKPFEGYSKDWFTEKIGDTRTQKARNWYKIMKKNLEKRIKTVYEFRTEVNN